MIETARSLAGSHGSYLTFEVGDIYRASLRCETFYAIFAHQVLQHLGQPVEALGKFGRF